MSKLADLWVQDHMTSGLFTFQTRWCSCTPDSRDYAAAKRANGCPTYGTQDLATQVF